MWWRNGRASDFRPRGQGFDSRSGRSCVTTLGKLFTPTCLDADSLRYYMVSLKPGTFTFTLKYHFSMWYKLFPKRVKNSSYVGIKCGLVPALLNSPGQEAVNRVARQSRSAAVHLSTWE